MKKAISVGIYKHNGQDCSNGGISSKFNEILLEHEEGWIEFDENNPPENLCKLVARRLFGNIYIHVEPVKNPEGLGWMSGGCVVNSCDSRYSEISSGYPLVLHDRQEGQELYNMLTND